MTLLGRKPRLTPERAQELRRRYAEGQRNRPSRLAEEFGLSMTALNDYVRGNHKRRELRP